MARPRKDEGMNADERMVEAFWNLLEATPLHNVTVRMVVEEADVNRGTFYYHFDSIDDLAQRAIEQEVVGDGSLMGHVFSLISGRGDAAFIRQLAEQRAQKMGLIVRQGGLDIASQHAKEAISNMWRVVLHPDGGDLSPEARLVIEYTTSGMIGLLAHCTRAGDRLPEALIADFLEGNSAFILQTLCRMEGVPCEVAMERLAVASRFACLPVRSEAPVLAPARARKAVLA